MGLLPFGNGDKNNTPDTRNTGAAGRRPEDMDDATYRETLESPDTAAKTLLGALDKAVSMQSGAIEKYVNGLKKKNPKATPLQLQDMIDGHFQKIATGSGAAAGATAAIPGIGFFTGAAAIGAESLLFLDASAWYIVASAYLRGADIRKSEVRRALVLIVLLGNKSSAIVKTVLGDTSSLKGMTSVATLSHFSGPTLQGLNGRLAKAFMKSATKRLRWSLFSKILPLGIGAVLGTVANRKLAAHVIASAHEELDPLPSSFAATTVIDH